MRPLLALLIFDPRIRKLQFRAGFILYLAVLVFGSIPGAREEIADYASGLVLHAMTYSVIALLLFCGANSDPWNKALKSFLIVAAMGAVDEWVQSLLPYRNGAISDWLVDITAAFITAVVMLLVWPKRSGRQPIA